MFRVTKYKVRANGKIYGPGCDAGDLISNLSPAEEERLARDGFGEIVNTERVAAQSQTQKGKFPDITGMNVEEVNKLIEETEDLEVLKKILDIEMANKKRTTILTPLEELIEELEEVESTGGEEQDLDLNFNPDDLIQGKEE